MENIVSIIMPVYNSEKYVKETILSVLNQSYTNIELIIINDGSIDNTEKICLQLLKDNPKIIRYFYKKNSGVSEARNYGLKKAKGKYITFIDSDDFYDKEFVKNLVDIMKNNQCELVSCAYNAFSNEKEIIFSQKEMIYTNINEFIENSQKNLLFNPIWNKLYLNEIIQNNKIKFNSKLDLAEDALFNIDYCKYCKKISTTNIQLYRYRIGYSGLGFKYRYDSGIIKLVMLKKLEKLYIEKNYSLDYINRGIVKQYISCFSNIVDSRNTVSLRKKIEEIKDLKNSLIYKENLELIRKRNKSLILKIIILILFSNKYILFLIGNLANIYDRINKKRIYRGCL